MSAVADAITVGMLADTERLRFISHNLANVGTAGFKRQLAITAPFERSLDQAREISGTLGPVVATSIDQTAGALIRTGNPLDLAIEGEGYFAIDLGEREAYTRQGTFRLNANGELVTASGQRLVLMDSQAQLTTSTPQIDSQGIIRDNGTVVGQIKIVTIDNPSALQPIGEGLLMRGDDASVSVSESARVRQGFTEASNVIAMKEMVGLLETVRHFEASQKLLQGYDAMLERAIVDLGSTQ